MSAISEHVTKCVKILNEALQKSARTFGKNPMASGYEAIFELAPQEWVDKTEGIEDWVEGYEQCLFDIVDAIADEWGVALPPFKGGE